MNKFKVTIHAFNKAAVLNPAENPTKAGLTRLGFPTVSKLRMGKCFIVEFEAADQTDATRQAEKMCVDGSTFYLINPVVETFEIAKVVEAI